MRSLRVVAALSAIAAGWWSLVVSSPPTSNVSESMSNVFVPANASYPAIVEGGAVPALAVPQLERSVPSGQQPTATDVIPTGASTSSAPATETTGTESVSPPQTAGEIQTSTTGQTPKPPTTAAPAPVPAPTTTAAPAPTTTLAPNKGGISVAAGTDLAALVSANPAGTAFRLMAGVHVAQQITPKDGNQFMGDPGAIMDGNRAQFAFAGSAHNVLIQGLIIEDYANSPQLGAIHGSGSAWIVRGNEVRYNATGGVVVPPGSLVTGNNIHHNGQIGLKAGGANVVIEGNEIAFNNHENAYDMSWEAGGTKFLETQNMIVRDNYVHDNHGPGLWTDFDNHGTLYEGNVVLNNYGPGIFHEISGSATIRNNRVEGNALSFYEAGILVANSTGVEVYNNTLRGNHGGVVALNQSREGWVTKNLWVRNNSMTYTRGRTGVFAQANEGEIWSSWNNRFDANTYVTGSLALPFYWAGEKTWEQWRAAGQDLSGSHS